MSGTEPVLTEQTEEQLKNTVGFGIDTEGFLVARIHPSKGVREVIGFFEQMKDWAKAYYHQQMIEEQKKSTQLVRPDGFLKNFKNKWNH